MRIGKRKIAIGTVVGLAGALLLGGAGAQAAGCDAGLLITTYVGGKNAARCYTAPTSGSIYNVVSLKSGVSSGGSSVYATKGGMSIGHVPLKAGQSWTNIAWTVTNVRP